MITLFRKKRLTEEKAANIFVNSIFELVENGFPEVAALINDDPEFITRPKVLSQDYDKFLLIIIAGNMKYIPDYFDNYQDRRIIDHVYRKLSHTLAVDKDILQKTISGYQSFFSRINHPSKNTLYAMSKAVFHKYDLNVHQEEYFKSMNSPNPLFLKRLDEIMINFIWDWKAFREKYKVTG